MPGAVVSSNLGSSLGATMDPTTIFYHRELLLRAKHKLLYARYADTVKLGQKKGREILMRRYAHLDPALAPLQEGVPPAGKKPTLVDIKTALKQYGDFIALTDFADMTGIDDYQTHWAGLEGDQAGYTMDAIERDAVTAGTSVIYSNGAARTDINSVIDGNDLDRAIRQLSNKGAETSLGGSSGSPNVGSSSTMPSFPAITLPDVLFTLQNIHGFKWASDYKGAAPDEVGRYKQIAFFISPDPSALGVGGKVFKGGGATSSVLKNTAGVVDVYTIMIYGKHGFTVVPLSGASTKMIRKALGSAGTGDPLSQVMTMGWINTSARLITNQDWLMRLECGAEL